MAASYHIAIDLGAGSGRIMLGTIADGKLELRELHRFPTGAITHSDQSLRSDISRIVGEIAAGLAKTAALPHPIHTISTDSWGVDYVWLARDGSPCALPYHYRDARNVAASEALLREIPAEEIYKETGIQYLPFNSIFQLYADIRENPALLGEAQTFLLIADYINFFLSGKKVVEESLASTTELYNPTTREWSLDLATRIGLPAEKLPEIVPSGTVLGKITNTEITRDNPNLRDTLVVASCSHDTGAAIAATPTSSTFRDWAYLSSGTWSLVGVELERPLITEETLRENFTNEIGYGHSVRFLKNISGMWFIQECFKYWADKGQHYEYSQIEEMALSATGALPLIDITDPELMLPGNMPEKISEHCRRKGQPIPESHGHMIRAILESLARSYVKTLDTLQNLTGYELKTLYITGGGSRNTLLNQLTANATGLTVQAGPTEATAMGNILVQAIANKNLPDLPSARRMLQSAVSVSTYKPI